MINETNTTPPKTLDELYNIPKKTSYTFDEVCQIIRSKSHPLEAEVKPANGVHIDNVLLLVDKCFNDTWQDIKRHTENNLDRVQDCVMASDYLRATKQELIKELSRLSV